MKNIEKIIWKLGNILLVLVGLFVAVILIGISFGLWNFKIYLDFLPAIFGVLILAGVCSAVGDPS